MLEKVLHQTLIEVHTAADEAWQQLRRHNLRDLETIPYPHAVPFKGRARCFRTAQLVPGSARGRTH